MASRNISELQHAWLMKELACWTDLGLVNSKQAERIGDLYGTAEEISARGTARALFTLTSLGITLVGLAVLLLVGFNWEDMPAAVKLFIVFAGILGTHAVAFWLRYRLGRTTASEIAFFLACLLYGVGIWQVAQIFQINAGDADGFWWWALGVLPFALALDTLLLHGLLVALLGLYVGFSTFGSSSPVSFVLQRWVLPASGAYSMLLMALPGLYSAYRRNAPRTVALYVPLLAWWVIMQPFAWRLEANPVYFVGMVGGLLLLIAECHPRNSLMAIPYRTYGAMLTVGVLVPLGFYLFEKQIDLLTSRRGMMIETAVVVVLAVILVLVVAEWERRASGKLQSLFQAVLGEGGRRWLPLVILGFLMFLVYWNLLGGDALIPTILANAALVALAFWLMQVGIREDRGRPFSAGVMLFLFWTIVRYIDLFGNFGGMLGASFMFFLCGLSLFGLAQYWQRRKGAAHV